MNVSDDDQDPQPLDRMLRELADAEARISTPARVEEAVLHAWDAGAAGARGAVRTLTPVTRPPVSAWQRARVPAAMAAAVVIAVTLTRLGRELQSAALVPQPQTPATLLLVGEPIAAGEPVHVVRMRVPAASLTQLGFVMRETPEEVDVDVLVGEDGVARGIRLGTAPPKL